MSQFYNNCGILFSYILLIHEKQKNYTYAGCVLLAN